MNKLTKEEHEAVFKLHTEKHPDTCGKCFCNDLCIFLLMETGVATTCEDFQNRVRAVVDREIDKVYKRADGTIKSMQSEKRSERVNNATDFMNKFINKIKNMAFEDLLTSDEKFIIDIVDEISTI